MLENYSILDVSINIRRRTRQKWRRASRVPVANSRTTASIRKCSSHKWSLYLRRTSNATLINLNMARMIYRKLRVIHEYSIWIRKNRPDSNRILQVHFESAGIEYVRTLLYTRRWPVRIRANSGPNIWLFAQCKGLIYLQFCEYFLRV